MKEISEARAIFENNNAIKVFKGIVFSWIITLILLFIYAAVLTYTSLEESTISPVIMRNNRCQYFGRKFYNYK